MRWIDREGREREREKTRIFLSMSYEDKCLMREHLVLKNDSPKDKWPEFVKPLKNDSRENS